MIPLALFTTIYLLVILWALPKFYVKSLQNTSLNRNQSEFDREKEKLKLEDDTRKTIAQIVGGAVFLFGLIFTYNTFILNREGQITDRFTKAVSQLGDEDIAVRLGGLYALERIAHDSPKDHWAIMEILSAYIREKSQNKKPANTTEIDQKKQSNSMETKQTENETIKTDVQAALTIIGRRVYTQDPNMPQIELVGGRDVEEDLHRDRIELDGTSLVGANFGSSNFHRANLNGTNLERANFFKANLLNASLIGANLSNANLSQADLSGANLSGANLSSANFGAADLTAADLSYADLSGADLQVVGHRISERLFEQLKTAIIDEKTKLPQDLGSFRQELLDISKKNLEEKKLKEHNSQ
jgi:uncharacterized protein YjbI with pentapeptide repeats